MTQHTREKILKESIHCIAQNPQATFEEIAAASGVGRATIYRHFKSRNELNVALKISAGEKLRAAIDPIHASELTALEKLTAIVRKLIPLGASLNVTTYFNFLCKDEDPRAAEVYEKHFEKARQLSSDLKKQGVVSGDVPLAWLTASLESLVFTAWETVQAGDIAPNAAPWLVLETFLSGVGTTDAVKWIRHHKEQEG